MKFIPPIFLLLSLIFNAHAQKLDNVVKSVNNKINSITHKPKTPVKPVAPNLENVEYPFPVQYIDLNLQNQDLKMAYMDVPAKKPNGDVVLLMHGKNFCSAYWKKTATDLSKAGYRVIMPDQIGFGKSSKPQQLYYSFQLLAQNTKSILDSLEINHVIVLGHSMGGMLATRFTLMYPDLVKKLILENPIGLEDYKLTVPFQTVDESYKKELKQTYDRLKDYQLTNYYGDHWKPEYDEWLNILAGMTLNADYPRVAWNAALTSEMIYMQPVCYEFEKITAPTLLIIGQRDRTALVNLKTPPEAKSLLGHYPELGKLTAKKIPNSKLIEIDNVGHLPHIEAYPKFITPLLAFLKEEPKTHNENTTDVKTSKNEKTAKTKLLNLKPKAKPEKKGVENLDKKEDTPEKAKEKEDKETTAGEKTEVTEGTVKDKETEKADKEENIEKTEDKIGEKVERKSETKTTVKPGKTEQKIKAKKKETKAEKVETEDIKTEEPKQDEEKTEEVKSEPEAQPIGKSEKAEQKIKAKKKETTLKKTEQKETKTEEPKKEEEKTEEVQNEPEAQPIGKSEKAEQKIKAKKKEKTVKKAEQKETKTEEPKKEEEKTEEVQNEPETQPIGKSEKAEQKIKAKKKEKKGEKLKETKEEEKEPETKNEEKVEEQPKD